MTIKELKKHAVKIEPKFIRTKDGIYEVVDENDRYYKCSNPQTGWVTIKSKIENDENGIDYASAEADTIEELCDEFIDDTHKDFYKIKKENGKTFVWSIKQRFKYWNSIDFDFVGTIYGAIWTDKGLIYVAKMNNDGELVLIWKD